MPRKEGWPVESTDMDADDVSALLDIARESSRLMDANRVWGGMQYNYGPIHQTQTQKLRAKLKLFWDEQERKAKAGL